MSSYRRIAHLDMDAFFASVELLRYPDLRGEAVVVGGGRAHQPHMGPDGRRVYARLRDYVGRGVVTTSTYEARALGVHSGMGLMKSAALAPDAVLLPPDFDAYRHYSRTFKAAVAAVVPTIEDRGIDEIYLDFCARPDDDMALAERLQAAVRDATGLTCSLGVSVNKMLAKLCSDLKKPNGITLLAPDEIPARIWPLPVRKINGIGPKAGEKLARLGIHSIGELAATPVDRLVRHFGAHSGRWLHEVAHGIDERPLSTDAEPKSISRETTFERDLDVQRDRAALSGIFTDLCTRLAGDLQRKGYAGRTIGIKLRFADFRAVTRDFTLPVAVADAPAIRRAAGECLKRIPFDQRLRLLGVRAGNLVPLAAASEEPGAQGELAF